MTAQAQYAWDTGLSLSTEKLKGGKSTLIYATSIFRLGENKILAIWKLIRALLASGQEIFPQFFISHFYFCVSGCTNHKHHFIYSYKKSKNFDLVNSISKVDAIVVSYGLCIEAVILRKIHKSKFYMWVGSTCSCIGLTSDIMLVQACSTFSINSAFFECIYLE